MRQQAGAIPVCRDAHRERCPRSARQGRCSHWLLSCLWLSMLFLLSIKSSWAEGTVHLVLSGSSAPYEQFTEALQGALRGLPSPPKIRRLTAEHYTRSAGQQPGLWVGIGTRAATLLGQLPPQGPVFLALVPREGLNEALRNPAWRLPQAGFSALYIDQPLARQLALIRAALPDAERLLVLLPPESAFTAELEAGAAGQNLAMRLSRLERPGELIPLLSRGLQDVHAFLALPDPRLADGRGIQNLLLATYRHGVPVFAYSRSFVEAGAAAAVYSTPEQLGRQAGEAIAGHLRSGGRDPLPAPSYPRYYEVAVNARVARSLNMPITDAAQLERAISSALGEGN